MGTNYYFFRMSMLSTGVQSRVGGFTYMSYMGRSRGLAPPPPPPLNQSPALLGKVSDYM